jgi:transcriptional antiterminator NusG
MHYFAIQVFTSQEEDFMRRAGRVALAEGLRLFVPKRVLSIRKGGKTRNLQVPVFPGYVFLESPEEEIEHDSRWSIRRMEGFIRFLKDSRKPSPLPEADRRILLHFISFGERADKSKVIFDDNDRIQVLEGPLKGLEGRITKVDRRRGRAKIRLDMCETGFLIDLGFEVVAKVAEGSGGTHGPQHEGRAG